MSHFLVDFACAYFIYSRFIDPWQWMACLILYNFFAFAMQAPLGFLADRMDRNAGLAAAGCLITAGSAFFSRWSVTACIIAGFGNALFHLGGGIDTLNESTEKCGKLGVFVSPGAFGIYFGTMLGRQKSLPYLLVVGTLVLAAAAIVFAAARRSLLRSSGNASVSFAELKRKGALPAALCFFLVVLLRSLGGNLMSFPWKKSGNWGLIFTCAVVFGKAFGGLIADRFGAQRSSRVTLGLAALLFCFADDPLCGTLAVFFFNMTMPVTLWAIARMLPGVKGFAFGTLTMALFLGLLPVAAGWLPAAVPNWTFAVMAVVSAVLLQLSLPQEKLLENAGSM